MNVNQIVKQALSKTGNSSKLSTIFKDIAGMGKAIKPEGMHTQMPKPPKTPTQAKPAKPISAKPVVSTTPASLDTTDLRPAGINRGKSMNLSDALSR